MLERKARSIGQESQKSLQLFSSKSYSPSKMHDTSAPNDYVTQAHVYSGNSYAPMIRAPFLCTDCGKKYKWLDSLKRHQRVDCGNKEKKFSCYMCDRKFKYRYELRNHINAHHGGWLFFSRAWLVRVNSRIKRTRDLIWVASLERQCSKYLWSRLKLIKTEEIEEIYEHKLLIEIDCLKNGIFYM